MPSKYRYVSLTFFIIEILIAIMSRVCLPVLLPTPRSRVLLNTQISTHAPYLSPLLCKFLKRCLLLLAVSTPLTHAQNSPFKLGFGTLIVPVESAPNGLSQNDDWGMVVSAEFTQDRFAASRLLAYLTTTQNQNGLTRLSPTYGIETQLLFGFGMGHTNRTAPRIYTGPTWRIEQRSPAPSLNAKTFMGWGWQVGGGFRYQAFTFDLSASIRDPGKLHRVHRTLGLAEPNAYSVVLMLSYQLPNL